MRYNDQSVQSDMKHWPFNVVRDPENHNPMIVVSCDGVDKYFSPEQISAMILSKMKHAAEMHLGTTVSNVVVTVPAYFNDFQRRATKDAGSIAGFNVMQIINEPTAAAIAYGIDNHVGTSTKRNVLIFDLGGGTFDVSILSIDGDVFEVKAVSGDTYLGGEDFDNNLVTYLVDEILRKHGKDIRGDAKALRKLRNECEKAKRVLSSVVQTSIDVDSLCNAFDFQCQISQAKFEELNMHLFKRCMDLVEMCLSDAKIDKDAIQDVVLVGGSTRIPMVQKLLQDLFNGKDLCRSINPDEAVASGAAVKAANLCGNGSKKVQDLVLLDVTPVSLGYEEGVDKMFYAIIPRNTSIPCQKKIKVRPVDDYPSFLEFNIYQGERARAADNNFLGKFTLSGFKPAPRNMINVDLCFDIDANGILTVSAVEERSGVQSMITITSDKGRLTRDQIDLMLKEAEMYKDKDNELKKKAVTKNALERYVYDMRNAITVASNLNKDSKIKIEEAIASTITWLETHELDLTQDNNYKMITKQLQLMWEPLVDGSYKMNLIGKDIDKNEGSTSEEVDKKKGSEKSSTVSKLSLGVEIGKLAMDVFLAAQGISAPSIPSFFNS